MNEPIVVAQLSKLEDREPVHAQVENIDLVIIRYEENVSVLYGRCLHRGAMMSDGHVEGDNLICGLHGWDYRIDTGVSEYNNAEVLHKFKVEIVEGAVTVDAAEIRAFGVQQPQPFDGENYFGEFADLHPNVLIPLIETLIFEHYFGELGNIHRMTNKKYPIIKNELKRNSSSLCESLIITSITQCVTFLC